MADVKFDNWIYYWTSDHCVEHHANLVMKV